MVGMLAAFGIAEGPQLAFFLPLILAVGFLFASLAMVVTSYARNFDFFTYYLQLFISPMFFFSGIFFPLSAFPPWVRQVSQCLPLTHAVDLARAAITGTCAPENVTHALALVVPGAIAFLYALHRMRIRLIK
jgi:lipooligosaccharide transport system permease protein